jgi:hypothetical protein
MQRMGSHTLVCHVCHAPPPRICKARLSATTKGKLRAAGYKDRRVLTPDDLAKALREVREGGGNHEAARGGWGGGGDTQAAGRASRPVHECRVACGASWWVLTGQGRSCGGCCQ